MATRDAPEKTAKKADDTSGGSDGIAGACKCAPPPPASAPATVVHPFPDKLYASKSSQKSNVLHTGYTQDALSLTLHVAQ